MDNIFTESKKISQTYAVTYTFLHNAAVINESKQKIYLKSFNFIHFDVKF